MIDTTDKRNEAADRYRRLTQVGPGTPGGKLMRAYWLPAGTVASMKDKPVRPVRLLGEDLVLFRAPDGSYGLIAKRCPHRGVSLEYGLMDPDGLVCPYHGWKFDNTGRCIDQPGEPAGSTLKDRIRIKAYPVQEMGGLLWTYMGPSPAPLLPRFDVFVQDGRTRDVGISKLPCNWLQTVENNMDPLHVEYLHMSYTNRLRKEQGLKPVSQRHHEKVDYEFFEYGMLKKRLWEGDTEDSPEWTTGHPVVFPTMLAIVVQDDWWHAQIRVPVDDTNTIWYWYNAKPAAEGAAPQTEIPVWDNPWLLPDGTADLEGVNGQDMGLMVSQGAITDHDEENLATSDRGVVMFRRALLEQIDRIEAGKDPIGTLRDPAKNHPWIELPRETSLGFSFVGARFSAIHKY